MKPSGLQRRFMTVLMLLFDASGKFTVYQRH